MAVLARYSIGSFASITPHPGGHINQSWRVRVSSAGADGFLLQRLNPRVFSDGAAVLRNLAGITAHLTRAMDRLGLADSHRRGLRLVPTVTGAPGVQAPDGAWWRLMYFIGGVTVADRVTAPAEAREAGRAFGRFLGLLADFDGTTLTETIPGFRDAALRVVRLQAAIDRDPVGRAGWIQGDLAALSQRRDYAGLLPPLMASGALPRRVVHNDAKSGNVLRDVRTGEGLAVVDLDTVMPGTALSDVGDLIRSTASPTDEDELDLGRIAVQPPLVEALARGYLAETGDHLTDTERRLFIAAGLVTTYEQAVRFFTDYLEGDPYYRTSRPDQNLDRGRAQLRLLQSLEQERGRLERLVAGI